MTLVTSAGSQLRLPAHFPDQTFQAALFDLDGTLIDSVPDLAAAVDHTLQQLGYAPAGEVLVRNWVGNGAYTLLARALSFCLNGDPDANDYGAHSGSHESLLVDAYQLFADHYRRHSCVHTVLYPGVRQLLENWAEKGVVMGLVTNKPEEFTRLILDTLKLDVYFGTVIGGDTLTAKKPSPLPLRTACQRLGCNPVHTLMIGDSRHDVEAGRQAGCQTLAVRYGYNHGTPIEESRPHAVVDSFLELL